MMRKPFFLLSLLSLSFIFNALQALAQTSIAPTLEFQGKVHTWEAVPGAIELNFIPVTLKANAIISAAQFDRMSIQQLKESLLNIDFCAADNQKYFVGAQLEVINFSKGLVYIPNGTQQFTTFAPLSISVVGAYKIQSDVYLQLKLVLSGAWKPDGKSFKLSDQDKAMFENPENCANCDGHLPWNTVGSQDDSKYSTYTGAMGAEVKIVAKRFSLTLTRNTSESGQSLVTPSVSFTEDFATAQKEAKLTENTFQFDYRFLKNSPVGAFSAFIGYSIFQWDTTLRYASDLAGSEPATHAFRNVEVNSDRYNRYLLNLGIKWNLNFRKNSHGQISDPEK